MKTASLGQMVVGDSREGCAREQGVKTPSLRMCNTENTENPSTSVTSNGTGLIMDVTIRCTVPGCKCPCFLPGKAVRHCLNCPHGWVIHALDKLGFHHLYNRHQVEIVQTNSVFDIASLILYGCHAIPVRVKILLDRLLSVLQHEEVLQILHGFGWTYEDYARGYILQDSQGLVLDKWSICSREEETLILQQFLRFGETKPITQTMLLGEVTKDYEPLGKLERTPDSEIKKFIERTNKVSPKSLFPKQGEPAVSFPQPMSFKPEVSNSNLLVTTSSSDSSKLMSPSQSLSPISPLNKLQNMQPFDFRKDKPGMDLFSMHNALSAPSLLNNPRSESFSSASLMSSLTTVTNCHIPYPNSVPNSFPKSVSPILSVGGDGYSDEEDSSGNGSVLNLSRSASFMLDPSEKKERHMRKPSHPVKRRWNPINLGTQLINPATGKKRVQCNVCLKTFCDKGALKIHFSAVHLKEMHKCTVEGCNMMFSSRRSRNRHSANPNPKLHTPHMRRKISPHDGRTAQPHPVLLTPSLANFNTLSGQGAGLSASGLNQAHLQAGFGHIPGLPLFSQPMHDFSKHLMDCGSSLDLSLQRFKQESRNSLGLPLTGHGDYPGGLKMNGDQLYHKHPQDMEDSEMDDYEEDDDYIDDEDDAVSVQSSQSVKGNASCSKTVRKRKSQNPTRCPVNTQGHDDDEDDSDDQGFLLDDDDDDEDDYDQTGSHVDPCPVAGDSAMDSDIRPEGLDLTRDRQDPPQAKEEAMEENISDEPACAKPEDAEMEEKSPDLDKPDPSLPNKVEETPAEGYQDESAPNNGLEDHEADDRQEAADDSQDMDRKDSESSNPESPDSSNALKQLENLSQGNFGDFMARNFLGQSPVLPGSFPLPFGIMGGFGFPNTAPQTPSEKDFDKGVGSSPSPPTSISPFAGFNCRDASFLGGSVDIPVDKDNPRRCIACGKIFQNHFGVKTHYQNVHLKLMHKCTVEGCNAAFPSKRSRDRHSSNLNLHRKLLSTSTDKPQFFGAFDRSHFAAAIQANQSLRDEFLSGLYRDPRNLGLSPLAEQFFANSDRFLTHHPSLAPGLPLLFSGPVQHASQDIPCNLSSNYLGPESGTKDISPSSKPEYGLVYNLEEDAPLPNQDGHYPCKFCHKTFLDPPKLRDHYMGLHLPELHKCTMEGCNKMFSSRKKRNLHCQNESIHPQRNKVKELPVNSVKPSLQNNPIETASVS